MGDSERSEGTARLGDQEFRVSTCEVGLKIESSPSFIDDRAGCWLQTYTGRRFSIISQRADDVELLDIAHALAHTCRFGGHVRSHYSVAQHSVLVSRCLPEAFAFGAILHDAAEAYLGDLIRDLKRAMRAVESGSLDGLEGVCAYDVLTDPVERAIAQRFGLESEPGLKVKDFHRPEVTNADLSVLAAEKRDLMRGHLSWRVQQTHAPMPERIVPLAPAEAERLFLERFFEVRP